MSEGNGVTAVAGNGIEHIEAESKTLSTTRKMSKIEMKRIQAYQERRRRLINQGVDPKKVDGVIAAEDYENMPLEKKFERLQTILLGGMKELQRDMLALRHNDDVITDTMDINLRAMARCLEKAGIDRDTQGKLITEVEAELREENKQLIEAKQAVMEKARMEAEAEKTKSLDEGESEGADVPEDATVFGG